MANNAALSTLVNFECYHNAVLLFMWYNCYLIQLLSFGRFNEVYPSPFTLLVSLVNLTFQDSMSSTIRSFLRPSYLWIDFNPSRPVIDVNPAWLVVH